MHSPSSVGEPGASAAVADHGQGQERSRGRDVESLDPYRPDEHEDAGETGPGAPVQNPDSSTAPERAAAGRGEAAGLGATAALRWAALKRRVRVPFESFISSWAALYSLDSLHWILGTTSRDTHAEPSQEQDASRGADDMESPPVDAPGGDGSAPGDLPRHAVRGPLQDVAPENAAAGRGEATGLGATAALWWAAFSGGASSLCNSVMENSVVLFVFGFLSLASVADIVTDLVAAVEFALDGHYWSAGATVVIFYLSGRFSVIFLALHPVPTLRNILCMYMPGCLFVISAREDDDRSAATSDGVSDAPPQPAETHPPSPGQGNEEQAPNAPVESQEYRDDLDGLTGTKYTGRLLRILKSIDGGEYDASMVPRALASEVVLIPFACFAIIPIGLIAGRLAMNYFEASATASGCSCRFFSFRGSGPTMDGGRTPSDHAPNTPVEDNASSERSGASRNDEERRRAEYTRKRLNLYLHTVSIVEALFESTPQLALQVRVGFYGGELSDWVFYVSVAFSSLCILKAVVTFLMNQRDILDVLRDLGDTFVYEFRVLPTGVPPPEGEGWAVATAAQVRENFDLLKDERSGLDTWYIATLANDMEVTGSGYNYELERRRRARGHVVYSRT